MKKTEETQPAIIVQQPIPDTLEQNFMPYAMSVIISRAIPEIDGFYTVLIEHPAVLRVVALSGGYSRAEANERLARNPALIASFSRALTEGLRIDQTPEEFDRLLADSIGSIYAASTT